jgi:hypothetical protein
MAKVDTVNVISMFGGIVDSIVSFSDDTEGNKEADELFTSKLKEHDITDEADITACLDNGHCETAMGKHEFIIVHS